MIRSDISMDDLYAAVTTYGETLVITIHPSLAEAQDEALWRCTDGGISSDPAAYYLDDHGAIAMWPDKSPEYTCVAGPVLEMLRSDVQLAADNGDIGGLAQVARAWAQALEQVEWP
ncbi:hypothetical protein P7L78_21870 [Tistrella bauzanensis]|uniref:hypothetical protein n=1 Tax=Tistrella TaxID=171436 RepID=UPI0031F65D03